VRRLTLCTVLAAVLAFALVATSAEAASKKKAVKETAQPAAPTAATVVLDSMSAPVMRGKRFYRFEFAVITMKISNLKRARKICVKRYALTEAFLVALYQNPINTRTKAEDRARVDELLLQTANKVLGKKVITGLSAKWKRSAGTGQRSVFGTYHDIICKGVKGAQL
jgi:hypothetical protein